jgi:hypothetical protein
MTATDVTVFKRHLRIRVGCTECKWSAGRSVGHPLVKPCFRCGAEVETRGEAYEESRLFCGCPGCGWVGERVAGSAHHPCPCCAGTAVSPLGLATPDGQWWVDIVGPRVCDGSS